MTVLVGNHDFLTGCKLNGDSVLNAEFCLEYVEISTNGVSQLAAQLGLLLRGIIGLSGNDLFLTCRHELPEETLRPLKGPVIPGPLIAPPNQS